MLTPSTGAMLCIRLMTPADIPTGMLLCQHAGFNQTEADWRRFLSLEPGGCFVAEWDGQAVGTVTNCVFGSIGWIAMLLVHKQYRGRGIGTRLMQQAMRYLESRGVATMRLDATPMGRPIYEKLGFVAEYELVRLEGTAVARSEVAGPTRPAGEDLPELVALDRQVTGTDRRRLIERLYAEQPAAMRMMRRGGGVAGYVSWRPGTNAAQIGPAMALEAECGEALVDVALGALAGQRVFIDIPTTNDAAMRWAKKRGLQVQRPFTRMRRGDRVRDEPSQLWASSGPEKG